MQTVTIPRDLFEELCEEAEFHAAARAAGKLGPYRAVVAEAARAVVTAGAFTRLSVDRAGRERRSVVRLRPRGRVKSGALCLALA